jgi:VWFA-related protein
MRQRRQHLVAIVAALAATFIPPLSAQVPLGGSRQEAPRRHQASAIVKLVPVRVLDAGGRPIRGLRKEDFTLYEDGEPKVVTEFEVHTVTEAGAELVPERPGPASARPAMGRKFFLFLDVQQTDPPGRQKALAVAERFLENEIRPGDEVGVLGFYSMSGFFIKAYLTTDIDRVRRALASLTETAPSPGEMITIGMGSRGNRHAPDTDSHDLPGLSGAGLAVQVFVPGTSASARTDFTDRLKEMAEVFKAIPGNKSLVLFSSRRVGPELGRLFGATGTAIFAVNTQDWMALPGGGKVKHIWLDHPLKDLAAASGGTYFADINQAPAIARELQELTGSFYVLGYYVKESWEGKFHRLRVEVAGDGAQVLAQDGYADPKPFAGLTDFEKDIQLVDLLWSEERAASALPLELEALTLGTAAGAQACLLGRLDVGAETGPAAARSEVAVLLRDEAGAQVLSRKWTVDLAPFDGQSVFPYLIVAVIPGKYRARLVVRDLAAGEACVGETSFEPGAAVPDSLCLFPPIIIEPGAEAHYLGLSMAGGGKGAGRSLCLADLYHLIPKDGRPVISIVAAGEKRLTVVLPFRQPASTAEEPPILSVEARVVSKAGGLSLRLGTAVRDFGSFAGGPDILILEIALPALDPGPYDLEISTVDLEGGGGASVIKRLVVR